MTPKFNKASWKLSRENQFLIQGEILFGVHSPSVPKTRAPAIPKLRQDQNHYGKHDNINFL
jgi:hypothetical protein